MNHQALLAATFADMSRALLQGRFRLARCISDAAWCCAHAERYTLSGDLSAARGALGRAALHLAEAEALDSGNAVSPDAVSDPGELTRAA